jgi:uncharacterized protein YkwD
MYASTYRRMVLARVLLVAAVVATALPQIANAGVLDAVQSVRREGCGKQAGIASPLRRSAALDRVAARWARGGSLASAEIAEAYRARRSVAMKLPLKSSDAAIAARLRSTQCDALTDPDVDELGLQIRGDSAWVVLAAPHRTPAAADAARIANEVLVLVNQARGAARRCGNDRFQSAPPLRLSVQLNSAALAHARDMAQHDALRHEGHDGSQPAQRAERAGYRWRMIGENVAGGPSTASEVVAGWLASPPHCRNIMERGFTEMGVGYATSTVRGSRLLIFWAQTFGQPR